MTDKNKKWVMPEWMEKYRNCFNNIGGNCVEDITVVKTNANVNIALFAVELAVSSQINLLKRLYEKGMLNE